MGVFARGRVGTKCCTFEDERVFFWSADQSVFASHNRKITSMPENKNLLARLLLLMRSSKESAYSFLLKKKPAFHPKVGFFV